MGDRCRLISHHMMKFLFYIFFLHFSCVHLFLVYVVSLLKSVFLCLLCIYLYAFRSTQGVVYVPILIPSSIIFCETGLSLLTAIYPISPNDDNIFHFIKILYFNTNFTTITIPFYEFQEKRNKTNNQLIANSFFTYHSRWLTHELSSVLTND